MLLLKPWSVTLLLPRPKRSISRTRLRSPRPVFLGTPHQRKTLSRGPGRLSEVRRCMIEEPTPTGSVMLTSPTKGVLEDKFERVMRLCSVVCLSFALFTLFSKTSFSPFAAFASAAIHSSVNAMSAWSGLAAGFLHTLAGPDHFAGLTPLTLRQDQVTAVSLGALWGFGHSSGTLVIGILFFFLKEQFEGLIPILSKWSGVIVGVTLIAIGFFGIYEGVFDNSTHHDDHSHDTLPIKGSLRKKTIGTYVMGLVHGLQLDALFVVLPALALPTAFATIAYVTTFVFGTIIAMAGYTFAIVTASDIATQKRPWLMNHLSTFAGGVSMIFGIVIIIGSLTGKL